MKKLIYILIVLLLLVSCNDASSPDKPRSSYDDSVVDEPIVDGDEPAIDDEGDDESVIDDEKNVYGTSEFKPNILIITNSVTYLSDGKTTETLLSEPSKYAGPRQLLAGNELIEYDASGDSQIRYVFDQEPVQALDNGSAYSCIEIDPDTALSLGAQAKWYSEFFKDGISLGFWFMNQMRCIDLIGVDENVWNIDESGSPVLIDGIDENVEHIQDGDFYMHSLDIVNKRVSFNDQAPQNFAANYILAAKQWQFYDGLWYSENGYTWSETAGLSEAANVMDGWNEAPFPIALPMAQYPRMVAAGVHDGLLYWIEADTGWLISFDTGLDEMRQVFRLYLGDGLTETGESKQLQPVMVWPYLYYFDSVWYQLDIETGFTLIFYAGAAEIREW